MAVLLPICCFGSLFLLVRRSGFGARAALLVSAVGIGVFVTLTTELLSRLHAITPTWLVVTWSSLIVATAAGVRLGPISGNVTRFVRPRRIRIDGSLVLALGVLVTIIALIGLLSAPSNWDSMTYHLVRVMHWMQNRSVSHYSTGDPTQLYHGPWAEFAMLHLQVLADTDRYAFLPQWTAFVVSAVGASLLATQIGANPRGQLLSGLFVLTIPGGVLQACSTQNNLVLSAWLISAAAALLWFRGTAADATLEARIPGPWVAAILFGAAIGLALLTKGTAYIFVLPLIIWFLIAGIRHGRSGVAAVLLAGAIAAALNAGHWSRNFVKFGSPLIAPADVGLFTQTERFSRRR